MVADNLVDAATEGPVELVTQVTLDQVYAGNASFPVDACSHAQAHSRCPSLVKIDVEGMESRVLEGSTQVENVEGMEGMVRTRCILC